MEISRKPKHHCRHTGEPRLEKIPRASIARTEEFLEKKVGANDLRASSERPIFS